MYMLCMASTFVEDGDADVAVTIRSLPTTDASKHLLWYAVHTGRANTFRPGWTGNPQILYFVIRASNNEVSRRTGVLGYSS